MLNPSKEYLEEQQRLIILHSARFCWRKRHQQCPKGGTWGDWFEKMYKISLDEYAYQRRKEKEDNEMRSVSGKRKGEEGG